MIAVIGPTLVLCLLLAYEIRKNSKIERKTSEDFWAKEAEANTARKRDISNLNYVYVPLDTLPFGLCPAFEELEATEEDIRRLASEKIYSLSGMTNTEVKLAYGIANFDFLCQCDERYLQLLQALSKEAGLLYSMSFVEETEAVLDYALSIGSDIPKDYLLLAEIYKSRGNFEGIRALISRVEGFESSTKGSLLEKLNSLLY